MRSVIFFRHGKSDWSADYDGDFYRPLAGRGRKASKRMGAFLARSRQIPDSIISSPAVRATRTVEIASVEGKWQRPVFFDDHLYGAEGVTVLNLIQHLTDDTESVMIVGHEPTMSECVEMFTGAGVRFPTAAMCRINFNVDAWRDILVGDGELVWLLPPRILR